MKTILILTDFSIRAEYAAEYALQVALKVKANILLCNVIEILDGDITAPQVGWPVADHIKMKDESIMDLKALENNLREQIPGDAIFKPSITCLCDLGKLSSVAAKLTMDYHVDLLIMGSHRANAISRFFFDSHTHDILDNIDCPVLLVPESYRFRPIKTLAYGTDLTFSNSKVIAYLSSIAQPFEARILISHIRASGYFDGLDDERMVEHSLDETLVENGPAITHTNIKADDIPESLMNISGSGKAEVMALVHKRYGFFKRLFHSSISKKMADIAKVPLLVMPYSFSLNVADLSNEQLDKYCYEANESR